MTTTDATIAAVDATDPIPAEPNVLKKWLLHTLESAGLVALSFILTTVIADIARLDVSHWFAQAQALWTYALPVLVLGLQTALKAVDAQKQQILAAKTMMQASKMMKNMQTPNNQMIVRGEQGEQGIQGIQGLPGDRGNQGNRGPVGPKSETEIKPYE